MQDVLSHLVRNSLDHGLETPEERQTAGKPTTGEISLKAEFKDDKLTLQYSDDGRGLNLNKIWHKASQANVATGASRGEAEEIINTACCVCVPWEV